MERVHIHTRGTAARPHRPPVTHTRARTGVGAVHRKLGLRRGAGVSRNDADSRLVVIAAVQPRSTAGAQHLHEAANDAQRGQPDGDHASDGILQAHGAARSQHGVQTLVNGQDDDWVPLGRVQQRAQQRGRLGGALCRDVWRSEGRADGTDRG